ncbi:MAG: hypothetical protein GF329_09870 [Candidatus Lokiarchaeota archaeon]|nr:hypothetical protein [Candidatus Lokiarchaeota archaeon]
MSKEIIPFVSSVTTELDERINEIMHLISELTDSMKGYLESVQDAINDIGKKIYEMLNETQGKKKYISESFSKIVKKIALKIKDVKNKIKDDMDPEMKDALESSSETVNLLEKRITDLQLIQIINQLSSVVSILKGEVANIKKAPKKPVSSVESKNESKAVYYEKGSKTKTMEEILEEERKRKKMFQKYR